MIHSLIIEPSRLLIKTEQEKLINLISTFLLFFYFISFLIRETNVPKKKEKKEVPVIQPEGRPIISADLNSIRTFRSTHPKVQLVLMRSMAPDRTNGRTQIHG